MLARGLGSWRAGKRKACAGGGVRDSSFGRPSAGCPAEGSSRQESSCLISLDLANAVVLPVQSWWITEQPKSPSVGKGRRPCRSGCVAQEGGFSTREVVFSQPQPPCHPCSVPAFVCFLYLVCLCECCDVFQMRLCAAVRAFMRFLLGRRLWPVM